jgi:hypothetical protein
MDAVEPGKMWDCKTSQMSQSPRAALNAFGLFAAVPAQMRARRSAYAIPGIRVSLKLATKELKP